MTETFNRALDETDPTPVSLNLISEVTQSRINRLSEFPELVYRTIKHPRTAICLRCNNTVDLSHKCLKIWKLIKRHNGIYDVSEYRCPDCRDIGSWEEINENARRLLPIDHVIVDRYEHVVKVSEPKWYRREKVLDTLMEYKVVNVFKMRFK